ncbi:polysaccharide pyruvyl transferase family protein [Methylococcaceae bacterium WWC4]|nr:polysaccharide pyruvyl transferase family protein [Methylococcaceae bacterium WWC4]
MKIGILTQPLHNNYGGLLQAYAMQKALLNLGHEPWTIDIWQVEQRRNFRYYYVYVKIILNRTIRRWALGEPLRINVWPTEKYREEVARYTKRFVKDHIRVTKKINGASDLKCLDEYKFDAYLVGSDQVWRPKYSPGIRHFFLDFVSENNKIRKFSYAASFGVENWEFSEEDSDSCRELIKQFDGVSVREDTGVVLCKEYLSVDAVHVLDPTLLLDVSDYLELCKSDNAVLSEGDLLVYIIDLSDAKNKLIRFVSDELSLKPFYVNKMFGGFDSGIYPPVTRWIRGFYDAKFVITDSFHGTVFSILFNKPFLVVDNKNRGTARFLSLLNAFGLQGRIVDPCIQVHKGLLVDDIDWGEINKILASLKVRSKDFLFKMLNA